MMETEKLSEVQNLFNQITLLNQLKNDKNEEVKKLLENEDTYNSLMSEIEALKEEIKVINLKKKTFMDKFKEKNETLYREIDTNKVKLAWAKERLVRQLLKDYKENKEISIYKEKWWKKVKMDIELTPKFRQLKKDEQNSIIDQIFN